MNLNLKFVTVIKCLIIVLKNNIYCVLDAHIPVMHHVGIFISTLLCC
jgi:hypothetical protein